MQRIDLTIDVTEAAGLDEEAFVALTVHLPDAGGLGSPPVVIFAKPGAGFTREYFASVLPGPNEDCQARWHAERGLVFVSVDHLGVGGSSRHSAPVRLGFHTVAAASHAAERALLDRLAQGTLDASFPPLRHPVVLGVGQSMGGALTVVQQGHHHAYDGIAILGYGAVHSHPPVPAGMPPVVRPWRLRDEPPGAAVVLNAAQIEAARRTAPPLEIATAHNDWLCHHDDVDTDLVRQGPWTAKTFPMGVIASVLTPGVIAPEAAAVRVPVLVAMGERDIIADPKGEPRAYQSSTSVALYTCPRMGHMHNFAGTRRLLWEHIDGWATWVTAAALAERSTATA